MKFLAALQPFPKLLHGTKIVKGSTRRKILTKVPEMQPTNIKLRQQKTFTHNITDTKVQQISSNLVDFGRLQITHS